MPIRRMTGRRQREDRIQITVHRSRGTEAAITLPVRCRDVAVSLEEAQDIALERVPGGDIQKYIDRAGS